MMRRACSTVCAALFLLAASSLSPHAAWCQAEAPGAAPAASSPPVAAGSASRLLPEGAPAGFRDSDFTPYTLGEIVVSGQTQANEVALYDEVSAEQIAATNSRTAAEALRYTTGVTVLQGYKNEPNVSIHGLAQQKVLVLIDGVPYYETNYGKLNLHQIPADIIAKIEVIKGAPSVMYGPNAEAGVVNIVTKQAGKSFSVSGKAEGGEKNYNRESLSLGGEADIFKYWISYTHSGADAWKLSDDFEPSEGAIVSKPGGTRRAVIEDGGYRNNSSSRSDSLWGKLGVAADEDTECFLNAYWIQSRWDIPPSVTSVNIFTTRPCFSQFARFNQYDDWGVDLNAKHGITDDFRLRDTAFYHNHQDAYDSYSDERYTAKIARSEYRDYAAGNSLFAEYDVADWDVFRLALHYKIDSHRERDDTYLPFAESRSDTGSVAAEDELTPVKNLTLLVGTGWDWFDVIRAQKNLTNSSGDYVGEKDLEKPGLKDLLTPMAGAEYKFEDSTRLFASVARKGRFPTLQQLYSSKGGNTDLEPETSVNTTVGASRSFFDDVFWLEAAYFNHYIDDWISRDGPSPLNQYQNYGKVVMNGLEVNAELKPLRELALSLGYTFNHARDQSPDHASDCVLDTPEHTLDLKARYTVPDLETRIDVAQQFTSKIYSQLPTAQNPTLETQEVDGYSLGNAKLTQPLTAFFDVYVSCDNIWDTDYETVYGFPQRGRTFIFGVDGKY